MSLYPTLTDFHGIATPKHVKGASLRPLLTDPQAAWKRPAITTYLQNSHTILPAGGEKKTLGLIYAGKFHLGTGKAERMEITAGACRVKIDGSRKTHDYAAGTHFEVPANSGFDIKVADGICEYVCSFLD